MAKTRHVLDTIALEGIVTVRDRLIAAQASGHEIYRLESGDPSFPVPEHIAGAMKEALERGYTHYTSGIGIMALREAACAKIRELNHVPVKDPEHTLITNGAMHGLYIAFRALLDPGDEVIVPDPIWTETADGVTLATGSPIRVPLDEQAGYRYDAAAIAKAITKRTCAIVINSPHNPTGAVASRDELAQIVSVAKKNNLWLISDEAYEDIVFDGCTHVSCGALGYDKVISVFSLSKSYAMAGLRLGYLACNDDRLIERMTKLLRCTTNGVNSVTQYGGVAALTGPRDVPRAMTDEYCVRRDLLWQALTSVKVLTPFKPSGAFYLWAKIDDAWHSPTGGNDGWAMTEFLIDKGGVGSAPGEVFGPAGGRHIRLSFSCATEQVEKAAQILNRILA